MHCHFSFCSLLSFFVHSFPSFTAFSASSLIPRLRNVARSGIPYARLMHIRIRLFVFVFRFFAMCSVPRERMCECVRACASKPFDRFLFRRTESVATVGSVFIVFAVVVDAVVALSLSSRFPIYARCSLLSSLHRALRAHTDILAIAIPTVATGDTTHNIEEYAARLRIHPFTWILFVFFTLSHSLSLPHCLSLSPVSRFYIFLSIANRFLCTCDAF